MFTTFVLMCHVMTRECIPLKDIRAIYPTEKQCMARAVEMSTDISKELPFMVAVKFKCVKEGTAT